ncbi:MAG TPA: protease complex subunit PrcB family protein [Trueperaceae bacterium]|jgi:hypothetical protein|nr:protease complex subunit PrcB family protein [Trueperaceae bacterium]HRQ09498.1 protease complex subunit PrcB family protein [Trueperaceae bacterium]
MPRIWLLVALVALVLGGCAPTSVIKMHDLYLYGYQNARYTHFYGEPGQLLYSGRTLTLTEPDPGSRKLQVPFAVRGALFVDGNPFLRESLTPLGVAPVTVSRIALTTDLQVTLGADVQEVVYYDGQSFLRLMLEGEAGTVQRVVPRPRLNGLRGLGELSSAEADALADALQALGKPLAIALLPKAGLPPHPVDGVAEQRRTGVYVQQDIGVDESAYRAAPEELVWDVVAQGSQAVGFPSASYQLVSNQDQLISLWQRAYGSQLTVPPVPSLDYRRETVVALFLGTKPSGGYGLEVRSVREEEGDLYVDLTLTEPAAGSITTQALTSPWLIIRVQRGGYAAAWLRDAKSGALIGVARISP